MPEDWPSSLEHSTPARGSPAPLPVNAPEASAEFRQLHPALRKVWTLAGLLTTVVMAVIVGPVEHFWLADVSGWPLPAYALTGIVFLIFAVYALLYPSLRYRAWRYAVRPHDVLLEYGVVWRMRRCIPRLRIQHVDIESGPIDRGFGMVKLSLYTAGTASAVGTIPGLLPEDAEALRETLLRTEQVDG